MQNGNYVSELPTDAEIAAQEAKEQAELEAQNGGANGAGGGSVSKNGGGPVNAAKLGLGANMDGLMD